MLLYKIFILIIIIGSQHANNIYDKRAQRAERIMRPLVYRNDTLLKRNYLGLSSGGMRTGPYSQSGIYRRHRSNPECQDKNSNPEILLTSLFVAESQAQLKSEKVKRAQELAAVATRNLQEMMRRKHNLAMELDLACQSASFAAKKAELAQKQLAEADEEAYQARRQMDEISQKMVDVQLNHNGVECLKGNSDESCKANNKQGSVAPSQCTSDPILDKSKTSGNPQQQNQENIPQVPAMVPPMLPQCQRCSTARNPYPLRSPPSWNGAELVKSTANDLQMLNSTKPSLPVTKDDKYKCLLTSLNDKLKRIISLQEDNIPIDELIPQVVLSSVPHDDDNIYPMKPGTFQQIIEDKGTNGDVFPAGAKISPYNQKNRNISQMKKSYPLQDNDRDASGTPKTLTEFIEEKKINEKSAPVIDQSPGYRQKNSYSTISQHRPMVAEQYDGNNANANQSMNKFPLVVYQRVRAQPRPISVGMQDLNSPPKLHAPMSHGGFVSPIRVKNIDRESLKNFNQLNDKLVSPVGTKTVLKSINVPLSIAGTAVHRGFANDLISANHETERPQLKSNPPNSTPCSAVTTKSIQLSNEKSLQSQNTSVIDLTHGLMSGKEQLMKGRVIDSLRRKGRFINKLRRIQNIRDNNFLQLPTSSQQQREETSTSVAKIRPIRPITNQALKLSGPFYGGCLEQSKEIPIPYRNIAERSSKRYVRTKNPTWDENERPQRIRGFIQNTADHKRDEYSRLSYEIPMKFSSSLQKQKETLKFGAMSNPILRTVQRNVQSLTVRNGLPGSSEQFTRAPPGIMQPREGERRMYSHRTLRVQETQKPNRNEIQLVEPDKGGYHDRGTHSSPNMDSQPLRETLADGAKNCLIPRNSLREIVPLSRSNDLSKSKRSFTRNPPDKTLKRLAPFTNITKLKGDRRKRRKTFRKRRRLDRRNIKTLRPSSEDRSANLYFEPTTWSSNINPASTVKAFLRQPPFLKRSNPKQRLALPDRLGSVQNSQESRLTEQIGGMDSGLNNRSVPLTDCFEAARSNITHLVNQANHEIGQRAKHPERNCGGRDTMGRSSDCATIITVIGKRRSDVKNNSPEATFVRGRKKRKRKANASGQVGG